MILMSVIPIFSMDEEKSKEDRRREQIQRDYEYCISQNKCPNEGKQLSEIEEDKRHETYHCRVNRHVKCSLEQEQEP